MPQYVVTQGCYVPIGENGGRRFKPPGVTVTLDEKVAAGLKGFVRPLGARRAPTSQVPDAPVQDQQQAVETDDAPAQSDTKDVWVEFAVSKGVPRDQAEGMTKPQLVEKFGSK
jgi:hypothetical protein